MCFYLFLVHSNTQCRGATGHGVTWCGNSCYHPIDINFSTSTFIFYSSLAKVKVVKQKGNNLEIFKIKNQKKGQLSSFSVNKFSVFPNYWYPFYQPPPFPNDAADLVTHGLVLKKLWTKFDPLLKKVRHHWPRHWFLKFFLIICFPKFAFYFFL